MCHYATDFHLDGSKIKVTINTSIMHFLVTSRLSLYRKSRWFLFLWMIVSHAMTMKPPLDSFSSTDGPLTRAFSLWHRKLICA